MSKIVYSSIHVFHNYLDNLRFQKPPDAEHIIIAPKGRMHTQNGYRKDTHSESKMLAKPPRTSVASAMFYAYVLLFPSYMNRKLQTTMARIHRSHANDKAFRLIALPFLAGTAGASCAPSAFESLPETLQHG